MESSAVMVRRRSSSRSESSRAPWNLNARAGKPGFKIRMLAEYLQATLPQLVERARFLKGRIPRGLPRDYDGLTRTCEHWLEALINQFRALQKTPATATTAVEHARLRQFRRAVADLNH